MHSRPLSNSNNTHYGTASMYSSSASTPDSQSPGAQQAQAPVAFAEFRDAECASSAMISLQGTYLLSSDRGPIRVEYAKSKMAINGGGGADPHVLFREVKPVFTFV